MDCASVANAKATNALRAVFFIKSVNASFVKLIVARKNKNKMT